ncbi:MAG TPA: DUF2723 domain-containing protein [Chroococcales cyanobacterium]
MEKKEKKENLIPLGIFALTLFAYFGTLLPGAGFWDTGVFQAVRYTLSFTHPTGYPFYILFGKVFCFLMPFGSIAFRMNLLSALSASAAASFVYLLCRRLEAEEFLSLGAALTFAFSQIFWRTAVRADPHTLHAFLVVFLLGLAVKWHQEKEKKPRLLAWLAFLYGLALGNHMMMTMLGPALAFFVLSSEKKLLHEGKRLLRLFGLFLLGASVYLYLPLRSIMNPPIRADYPLNNWSNFWRYALGRDFKGEMNFLSLDGPRHFVENLPRFLGTLADSISPIGLWITLILAAFGLCRLFRKNRKIFSLFSLALLVPLYAALSYVNGDIDRYYFTAFEVILVLAALGGTGLLSGYEKIGNYFERIEESLARLEKREALFSRWPDLGWLAIAAVILPLCLVPLNRGRVGNISAERFGKEFLSVAKPEALVMSWWNYSTPLWYFHFAEGKRPDIEIYNGIDKVPAELFRRFDGKRPIYLIQPGDRIEALSKEYRLERVFLACGETVYEVKAKIKGIK